MFLVQHYITTLSSDKQDLLDALITQEEVRAITMPLKSGKSPGSEGFPVEYY